MATSLSMSSSLSSSSLTQLIDLPSFAFTLVPFLIGEDLLSLREVSKGVQKLVDDDADAIWSFFLHQDFDGYDGRLALRVESGAMRGPSVFGTMGSTAIMECSSAFETWKQWKRASFRYYGMRYPNIKPTYFLDAARIWARLEQWLSSQGSFGSNLQSSLRRGGNYASLQSWDLRYKSRDTVKATQAMLAFYSGQDQSTVPWSGLWGGFSVYNFVTCTLFVSAVLPDDIDTILIGACPMRQTTKHIGVNPENGQVICRGMPSGNLVACTYVGLDAVLVYFDEYVKRLEAGYYQIGPLFEQTLTHGPADAILLHPRQPNTSPSTNSTCNGSVRTVTRGVEVIFSAVYSPWTRHQGFSFVYSIRIRLLQPGEPDYEDNRGFDMCQLQSRHWRLTDMTSGRTEHVDGDGVIGLYPLLRSDGSHRADLGHSATQLQVGEEKSEVFCYQSCTNDAAMKFSGHLLFMPGLLLEPTGLAFPVHVGPYFLTKLPISFIKSFRIRMTKY